MLFYNGCVVLVDVVLVVNTNVATESNPTLFVEVYVYVPGAVLLIPFQVYDGVFTHTATSVVLVDVGEIDVDIILIALFGWALGILAIPVSIE